MIDTETRPEEELSLYDYNLASFEHVNPYYINPPLDNGNHEPGGDDSCLCRRESVRR